MGVLTSPASRGSRQPRTQKMKPIRLFYSYSHRDEALRDQLETHLSQLVRRQVITKWHDRQISAGSEWEHQIDKQIELAQMILMLVSSDFLASNYCYGIEMMRAMERHAKKEARVIPVILRPCDWLETPFGQLQALPTDAKPVTLWSNHDEAWLDVVRGIRVACGEIGQTQESGVRIYAEMPAIRTTSAPLAWPKCSVSGGAVGTVNLVWGQSVMIPLEPDVEYSLTASTGIPMSITVAVASAKCKVRKNEVLHYVYRVVEGDGTDWSEIQAQLIQVAYV